SRRTEFGSRWRQRRWTEQCRPRRFLVHKGQYWPSQTPSRASTRGRARHGDPPSCRLTELLVPSSIDLFMCEGKRACSMQAAEGPDQQEDRDWYAEQPQQHVTSHLLGSCLSCRLLLMHFRGPSSVGSETVVRPCRYA